MCQADNSWSALIKKKTKFSSYIRNSEGIGCKVIYDYLPPHIWLNIFALPHILGSSSSFMTLQLIPPEFPDIWGKFRFLFYQCANFSDVLVRWKLIRQPSSFSYYEIFFYKFPHKSKEAIRIRNAMQGKDAISFKDLNSSIRTPTQPEASKAQETIGQQYSSPSMVLAMKNDKRTPAIRMLLAAAGILAAGRQK
jgi:hypothetical protein